jgi:hypothetical protein
MKKSRIIARLAVLLAVAVLVVMIEKPAESLQGKSLDAVMNNSNEDIFAYLPLLYTPCGPGELWFSDDFSDPNSGWQTWDVESSQATYLDGEFRILVKVENSRAGLARGDASGGVYLLSADVRNATGLPGRYGLLFGFQGALDNDFYTFEIGPLGDYFVYYHENDYPDPMQTTLIHTGWSAAILTGVQSNNLAVVHRPSTIYLYANDQLLITLPNDRDGAEQLGMWASSTTEPNLDARFDNFEVYGYECYLDNDELESIRPSSEATKKRPFIWKSKVE